MDIGFSKKSLQFLKDIESHNNRQWYAQHKPVFQTHLLEPFKRLVSQLSDSMLDIDLYLETTPAIDKTISRIYRDTRFSHDKRPYRGNMWLVFKRRHRQIQYPAFFFEIYPDFYHYGLGFYQAPATYMRLYREAIARDEKAFLKIINAIKKRGQFSLEGELYQRSRYQGGHPAIGAWFNRKNLFVVDSRENMEEILDFAGLAKRLEGGFKSLAGLYNFLLNVVQSLQKQEYY